MLNQSYVIGADYHQTPLHLREQLSAVSLDTVRQAVPVGSEVMLLSTCNRFELYARLPDGKVSTLLNILQSQTALSQEVLQQNVYVKRGAEMVRHGFRVASSLESMVLGEPQILGQMKAAYHQAKDKGTLGDVLEPFCHRAFHVGKRVRHETGLSQDATSVAAQALSFLTESLPENPTILLIGAGDMGKAVLTNLQRYKGVKVLVCSRTFSKANLLASFFPRVSPVCMEGLSAHLNAVDGVISATSSSIPIITKSLFKEQRKPLTLVDIAVPRDIAPDVAELSSVSVYTVDDLQEKVVENTTKRQSYIAQVDGIIEEELASFLSWTLERKSAHMIDHLRAQMERYRQEVLDKCTTVEAEEATRLLLNKILHHPSLVLKSGQLTPEEAEESLSTLLGVSCPRVRVLPMRKKNKTLQCPFHNL